MIQETIPAIQDLTVDQKLRLVWELWTYVSRQVSLAPGTAELLDERLAVYDANPNEVKTTDEVTAGIMRLKQRLGAKG
ncbi:MAG TPA: hypothetical protein VIT91_01535 [Chthoniobacterales bacterium]